MPVPDTILSPRTYLRVWGALLGLLALSVAGYWLPLGPFNLVLSLGVAAAKTALIILFFMHVRYGPRLNWLFAALGFYWLGIMLVLSLSDYLSRDWLPLPGK